jgi:hypothetical protein
MNELRDSLEQRVERLERQNRRFRWFLLTLPVLALVLGAEVQKAVWKGKTVVAEEFILADADGKTRALLNLQKDGPHFFLLDNDGKVRVNLAADSEGNCPALFLINAEGKSLATLRRLQDGSPVLALFANDEKPVLIAGRNKDNGVGFVEWHDGKGNFKGSMGGNSVK